jgi:hypothetical protein
MPPRLTFLINCFDNEVWDVINGDRRLTVREVADKCGISKTTAHQILGNYLNMNRVCARWVPQILTAEHLTNPVFSASNPDFSAISKL